MIFMTLSSMFQKNKIMPNRDRRNYGGFPIRSEIVKEKRGPKEVQAAKADNIYLEQYAMCQCSLEVLKEPILVSKMGKLWDRLGLILFLYIFCFSFF